MIWQPGSTRASVTLMSCSLAISANRAPKVTAVHNNDILPRGKQVDYGRFHCGGAGSGHHHDARFLIRNARLLEKPFTVQDAAGKIGCAMIHHLRGSATARDLVHHDGTRCKQDGRTGIRAGRCDWPGILQALFAVRSHVQAVAH